MTYSKAVMIYQYYIIQVCHLELLHFVQRKMNISSQLMPLAHIHVIIINVGEGSVGLYLL